MAQLTWYFAAKSKKKKISEKEKVTIECKQIENNDFNRQLRPNFGNWHLYTSSLHRYLLPADPRCWKMVLARIVSKYFWIRIQILICTPIISREISKFSTFKATKNHEKNQIVMVHIKIQIRFHKVFGSIVFRSVYLVLHIYCPRDFIHSKSWVPRQIVQFNM